MAFVHFLIGQYKSNQSAVCGIVHIITSCAVYSYTYMYIPASNWGSFGHTALVACSCNNGLKQARSLLRQRGFYYKHPATSTRLPVFFIFQYNMYFLEICCPNKPTTFSSNSSYMYTREMLAHDIGLLARQSLVMKRIYLELEVQTMFIYYDRGSYSSTILIL